MATQTWHDLGPVAGDCTVCGAEGRLSMGECRVRPSAVERLRRTPLPQSARLVVCAGCSWRWTVRATDTPVHVAAAVAHRAAEPVPVRSQPDRHAAAATRTVLPSPPTQPDRRRLTARLH